MVSGGKNEKERERERKGRERRKKIAGRIDGRGSRRGETNYLHVLFTADS